MKEKRYNHAFDVAFQVPDSKYEDWFGCLKNEKQMVINALQRRIRELFEAKEYLEAISGFDTYDEDSDAQMEKDGFKVDESVLSPLDTADIEKSEGLSLGLDGTTK